MACKVLAVCLVLTLSSCVLGLTSFSSGEQVLILNKHNEYRRIPGASNMIELAWDPVLATQAQEWTDLCNYAHPNTKVYPDYVGVGQNLFIRYEDPSGTNPPAATDPVTSWNKEVDYFTFKDNSCQANKVCGHYTQVVWADTDKVGCGRTFCRTASSATKTYNNAWIVACGYTPSGNYFGKKPYNSGTSCSGCPTGLTCSNKLCAAKACEGADCNGNIVVSESESCEDLSPDCGHHPGYPFSFCETFDFVKAKCPRLCNLCGTADA